MSDPIQSALSDFDSINVEEEVTKRLNEREAERRAKIDAVYAAISAVGPVALTDEQAAGFREQLRELGVDEEVITIYLGTGKREDMPGGVFHAEATKPVKGKYDCPKCGSSNTCVGAFLLGCEDCGWSYLNKYPCDAPGCGKPSTSSCSMNGKTYHGCPDHSASAEYKRMLSERGTAAEAVKTLADRAAEQAADATRVTIDVDNPDAYASVELIRVGGCPEERVAALVECVRELRANGFDATITTDAGITVDNRSTGLTIEDAMPILNKFADALDFTADTTESASKATAKYVGQLMKNRGHKQPRGPLRRPIAGKTVQAGRNDPCPCGSKKKFKACHGRAKNGGR